jgi:hypothetical protein
MWSLQRDTGASKLKRSSHETAAFFMDHPIMAIVTLWVIGIIGFVCLLQLPIR